MVDPILQSGSFQLAQKMLDASALRQEAIASNIANADTPGYHRIDLAPEFAQQLKAAYQAGESPAANDLIKPRLTEDPNAR
ncbi:MAG TPA: flagellar basal body protein, partial [Opitutaceae bacterium]|nr:flagellar basal body protein [Opitutaceae bacterium]